MAVQVGCLLDQVLPQSAVSSHDDDGSFDLLIVNSVRFMLDWDTNDGNKILTLINIH